MNEIFAVCRNDGLVFGKLTGPLWHNSMSSDTSIRTTITLQILVSFLLLLTLSPKLLSAQ